MTSTEPATGPTPSAKDKVLDWLRAHLFGLAVANLIANIGIVVTGGVVRLTGSGLGCPTWPKCTEESYVAHEALGINGVIEFGNRLLTYVVAAIAITVVVAAWNRRGVIRNLAIIIAFGVPLQAVLGGFTVLSQLNPYVVALHLLASMAMVGLCVWLLDEIRSPGREAAPRNVRVAAVVTFVVGWLSLWLGTVVTGSGPHSGDLESRRTGLDPALVSHIHAYAVYALIAATLITLWLGRKNAYVRRVTVVLLVIELAQGLIGWVQYLTDLPVLLVGFHMLGAALISAGLARVVVSTRAHTA
ncbi:COX15/CtaA family protein [Nocardioides albus]|uniref:Cytochrome c oxidase assembly protein subunit 15 n=1 Tax=Nocardioides albus TaxID=1841 RepID=A0A7W5A4K3_9ACTN|nr:COX15/CtaA family protein [Nocardioides albus]MBB3089578.1 cytochrome c oxidase assembly protein subunit 15 [Nocardioides albus]GGU30853.1 cytochrome b561 [Nocardioides albus]